MKLRARLALTTIVIVLPLIAGVILVDAAARHDAAARALEGFTRAALEADGAQAACEADPARWGAMHRRGPRPPPLDRAPRPRADDGPATHAEGPSPTRADAGPTSRVEGESPPHEDATSDGPPRPGRPPHADLSPPTHAEGGPPPHEDATSDGPPRPGRPPHAGPPPDDHPRARPAELFAYDDALAPRRPGAPALDPSLARALEGADVVVLPWSPRSADVELVMRTPWGEGPCAHVLARGNTVPGWLGAILPATRVWLAPIVIVFATLLLAVGPIVGRLRRLTAAVRRPAEVALPVEGDDEIAELAGALVAARREVQVQLAARDRRERALRDFLANTTHDVMIPLTVLQGHLSALEAALREGATPEPALVRAAMGEAHYLGSILRNLALMARLDADEAPLQRGPVDLGALVERVLGRHRPIAGRRGVSLEGALPEAPPIADADVTLLEQALSNLVDNALRYNHEGGHVAVLLTEVGDRFRIRVVDDGPGIPAEALGRLQERGVRGDEARTRSPDGQGLGLSIVLRVAALHGFTVTMGAAPSGGLQVDLEGPR